MSFLSLVLDLDARMRESHALVRQITVGGFAYIFGRRPVMVASILVFALGSALTGAAQNVPMLIAGRTVQGMGGGGIQCLVGFFFFFSLSLSKLPF